MKKLVYISSLMLLLAHSAVMAQKVDMTLLGAGASFPNPLYSKMFYEYNKITGLKVNYQSIGSGGGIQQLTNKLVDFGASDAPLNGGQDSALSAPAIHIPITAGAVVVCYNVPGVSALINLSGPILANIFMGKITKWNAPEIMAVNKGAKIPAMDIIVAHRSDGSGTSNIFTTYLSKVSPEWMSKVGKGSAVNWPTGLGGKGNEGVAGLVKQTPGTIGYIELAYAIQNAIPFATMQNKAGKFIAPSVQSTSAAANIELPEDAKVSLTNTDAANGYPISGFTWLLVYREQNYNNRNMETAKQMVKLFWWMTHEGQKYCEGLNYAPLPKSAIKVAEKNIKSIKFNGKPLM